MNGIISQGLGLIATNPITTTRDIFSALTQGYAGNLSVRLWDGSTWQPSTGPTPFTLVLKHPGAVRAMFWPFTNVGVGESYIFDDYDIEGGHLRTHRLFAAFSRADGHSWHVGQVGAASRLDEVAEPEEPTRSCQAGRPTEGDHSIDKEREAISYTYDLPGEFYKLFLDRNMQYTCGYFARPDEDLDAAQERKLDYICRKLRLKPGERYIDFGCGWGNLIAFAAKHYGVQAVGVTLSQEQAKWAERNIAEAGVSDRAKVVICDYREFSDPTPFDKASSVGISEHIGNTNLPVFLKKIHGSLRPGGVYMHHCITLRPNTPFPRWTPFARKYVFPNGELQTILHVQTSAAEAGFEIRDVESLREHYVLTLENWTRKLEANRAEAVRLTDEVTYRIFRIYMAGATMGFRTGVYNLNQCLFAKPHADGRSDLPLMRAEWYVT